jgi:hypothetical protein
LSLEFIDKIYGSSQGLIDIVTFGSDGKPNSERWFEFPEERDRIEQYIGWRADEDVFTSVNLFSSKKRTNADTEAVARAVGVDADTCHPDNFRVPPSARVQTGEGRWHCWWFLDEEVPAAEAALTAKRICTAHESQGCDKPYTHNVAKILRVPGTTNTKHANDDDLMWEVEVEYDPDAPLYTLDTLNAVYDDIAVAQTRLTGCTSTLGSPGRLTSSRSMREWSLGRGTPRATRSPATCSATRTCSGRRTPRRMSSRRSTARLRWTALPRRRNLTASSPMRSRR